FQVTPLGLDEEWKGGDMEGPGGGFKINLLRQALEPLKDEQDTIVLFTDSYDVVFTTGLTEILRNSVGLINHCLANYPTVEPKASPYLNSGAFIGYVLKCGFNRNTIEDTADDQLYYTKVFLNEEMRQKLDMKLDTTSTLFQNLNGAKDDVKLDVDLDTNKGLLKNINFLTTPSIIQAQAKQKDVDYIFFVDADVHIDDPEVLRELLQFVAPVVTKYNELWSNFWGALSEGGYYARSPDYVDIVKSDIV
ncbi:hypothetical protein DOY81_013463, partial [Sarcophaga bullata]